MNETANASSEVAAVGRLPVRPVTRYGPHDTHRRDVRLPQDAARGVAGDYLLGGRRGKTTLATLVRSKKPSLAHVSMAHLTPRQRARLLARILVAETPVVIRDVQPRGGRIMSDRPFALDIEVAALLPSRGIVRAEVSWDGEPFVVEGVFTAREIATGRLTLPFDKKRTLPTGPAAFSVIVSTESGHETSFVVTCAVLPSNPFALRVSPRDNFVTGTFSARAVRSGSDYSTAITVTLSNGDGSAVRVRPAFHWEFWDGPVGSGTRIERGDGSFGSSDIRIGPYSTWSGWIVFTSPPGSGIFHKLNSKEDLAVMIQMRKVDGTAVRGEITVRTMFRFGLNITRVGAESFTALEYADLYQAVDVTRQIYERRDVTLSVNRRHITNAQAGGYTLITSEHEARDLFEDWSGPDNDFIDVFVGRISGTSFDGLAGDIPGPTSHAGRRSGVVVDRSAYTDPSGRQRLRIPYLGMLIGHEVGHYLGLSHVSTAGNLMLPSSGPSDTALDYSPQYRTIVRYGWVRID